MNYEALDIALDYLNYGIVYEDFHNGYKVIDNKGGEILVRNSTDKACGYVYVDSSGNIISIEGHEFDEFVIVAKDAFRKYNAKFMLVDRNQKRIIDKLENVGFKIVGNENLKYVRMVL